MQDGVISKPGVRVAKVSQRTGTAMRKDFAVRKVEFDIVPEGDQLRMMKPGLPDRRSKRDVSLELNFLKHLRREGFG